MDEQRPRLSLAHLTVLDASPAEVVSAAASAGFDAVGLRLRQPPGVGAPPTPGDGARVGAALERLNQTGLSVLDVEVLWIDEQTRAADYHDLFEAAARLGAENLLAMSGDPNSKRLVQTFGEVCQDASGYGLNVCLEFAVFTAVRTLREAERVVRASGEPNARILIDTLHLFRSGGSPEDVVQVDPSLLGYLQFCDATAVGPSDPADCRVEARTDRRYPGEGELPLQALLRVLPANLPIAVEAPCKAYAHLSVESRASLALDATRGTIAAAQPRQASP